MHNLALALQSNDYTITGSDDEIYNPSRDRLARNGLLPDKMGWFPGRIDKNIDAIILGMHARKDNPELKAAQKLGIPIYSYPEFVYKHAEKKLRVVVAGSHGKTTTTSMIMHVLEYHNFAYDYLVGAQLEGFERMVRLSDAPIIIIEGDEYLSSPIDRRPKFVHYHPHIAIMTGIAWDHINVFPKFKDYVEQFGLLADLIQPKGSLIYYDKDKEIQKIVRKERSLNYIPYSGFDFEIKNDKTYLKPESGRAVPLKIFGAHNLQNLQAAYHACQKLGIDDKQFFKAIRTFKGAAKRLQLLKKRADAMAWLDFAHAPSKVKATVEAVKGQYPKRKLVAALELHTFSSLNKNFFKHYKNTMNAAERAFVYYSEHTLKMKKLPPVTKAEVKAAFNHPNITVFTENDKLVAALHRFKWKDKNLLLMSSGTFNGVDLKGLAKELLGKSS